jgi:hypothetical protein
MLLIIALVCFLAQVLMWVVLPASTAPAAGHAPADRIDLEPLAIPVGQ